MIGDYLIILLPNKQQIKLDYHYCLDVLDLKTKFEKFFNCELKYKSTAKTYYDDIDPFMKRLRVIRHLIFPNQTNISKKDINAFLTMDILRGDNLR